MSTEDHLGPQWQGMHRAVFKHGGFTVNQQFRQPTSGYMVAVPGHEEITPSDKFEPEHIRDYRQDHATALSGPGAHHGAWHDPEHKRVVQDVSERFPPDQHHMALLHTVVRNEAEAYDLGGHGGMTKNIAYEHALSEDRPRREARSASRAWGENVGEVSRSTREQDFRQAREAPDQVRDWFRSAALPHPEQRSIPRTAGGPHPGLQRGA